MKKIDYNKALAGRFQYLLGNPEEFAEKIGVTLITGTYPNAEARAAMAEALVVWMGVNTASAFYDRLESRLARKSEFSRKQYMYARDSFAQNLLLSTLSDEVAMNRNAHLHTVCMYMSLPNEVARKWLWHENVDFQSCESLLRRLTDSQYESLKTHHELVVKANSDSQLTRLPCFTEGALNKVWRLFNIASTPQDRMAIKSALAHDFLGMGMGFGLYSNADDDRVSNKDIASQFLSKQDRGAFEVNKEQGGLYWFLYRTLRSNSLYRKNADVELGRWVCPGFWFTMIMWGIFLVISPVCLAGAVSLYATKGVLSWSLFGVGAILPSIFVLSWAKKIGGKAYGPDYWKGLFASVVMIVMFNFVYEVIVYAKDFLSFPAGIFCAALLLPYCLNEETGKFWRAPVLGIVLPLIFLSALAVDLQVHSNFFEVCWAVVQEIGEAAVWFAAQIYAMRYMLLVTTMSIAGYVGLVLGLIYFSSWTLKKTDTMIEKGDTKVYTYERMVNWGILAIIAMVAIPGATVAMTLYTVSSSWLLLLLVLVLAPFAIFLFTSITVRGVSRRVSDIILCRSLSYDSYFSPEQKRAIRRGIAGNIFWDDVASASARGDMLNHIFYQTKYKSRDDCFKWVIEMIRSVKNDTELSNVLKFVSMEDMYTQLHFDVTPKILELIFSGAEQGVIQEAIDCEKEKWRKLTRKDMHSTLDEYSDWANGVLHSFLNFLYRLTWPVRALWKGVGDLYRLWKDFNEQCPQSPPSDRPLAQ